jgi:hypothetical protein
LSQFKPELEQFAVDARRPQENSPCASAGSARAIPPRSAVAPVDAISNANSGESRLDANQRFGSNNHENRKDRPAIELSEDPAILVRETSPALQLTPQDPQLMSERGILSLTLDLRLEW